ncbi:unnamed protein product [Adineta steineri]|uniref:G-protein coupled receptors family 1 profile domain-containing protein n=1 Tax=Adineta steineri TaxID=433720 RepID=A0A814S897_9BILA|nr:unnamed protein product [Adineta steineri]CAF1306053.1 unnamed protein product [Adineta steineri]
MSTAILSTIQSQLNFYTYTIVMAAGNIGNIFVLILFTRQRQNACSIYLISSTIVNSIYLTFTSFIQLSPFDYTDGTTRAFILCKLRSYLAGVLGLTTKTLIVLACIDRFMITNRRANLRAFSTPKRAKYFVCFFCIFWPIFGCHAAVMTTIINRQCGQFGIYSIIYTIYVAIFVGFIPPITSGTLGYLTYKSLRQRRNRIEPVAHHGNNANAPIRRRDRELLIMVMSEVFVYIITSLPYPFILLEMMISRNVVLNKSIQYTQIELFIFGIALLLVYMNAAAPFYIYIISSKGFRREFKQLIMNFYRKQRGQPTLQRTTQHTLTQNGTHVQ